MPVSAGAQRWLLREGRAVVAVEPEAALAAVEALRAVVAVSEAADNVRAELAAAAMQLLLLDREIPAT